MRALSTDAVAALSAPNVVLVTLLLIEFPGGDIALNSSNMDLEYGGRTYLGADGLGSISAINDTPSEMPGVQLELQKTDSAMIGVALDDRDEVQGSPMTISTAILSSTTYQIVAVEVDWAGYADRMVISEDGEKASIGMTAESKAVDLLRGQALLYADGDQQAIYPGDRAFEYVVSQVDQPVVWPNRGWFFK